nr:hypothetical protein [Bacillota bacterium]
MSELFIYISLVSVFVLFLMSSIIYKKTRVWKLLLVVVTLGIYAVIKFIPQAIVFMEIDQLTEYYTYFLYLMVLVMAVFFKNKIRITQNLTDYDFFELEKELDEVKDVSDLLRLRFINTIGLLSEGLIFYEPGLEGLFITERAAEITGAKNNELSIEEYLGHIHDEDQSQYLQ